MIARYSLQLALALASVFGFWGLGRAARHRVLRALPDDGLTAALDLGIGAWLVWTGMFAAGLSGQLQPSIAWAFLGAGLVAGAAGVQSVRRRGFFQFYLSLAPYDVSLFAVRAGVVMLAVAGALTPPAAQDALVHHLALPKTYIIAGGLPELPFNYFSYFPAGMEMLYLQALLTGGAGMATLLHCAFGVATASLIASEAGALGSTASARLLAAAAFLTVPTVWMEMTWAYVDLTLAFFTTIAVLALLRFRRDGKLDWVLASGVALGAALSVKFTALVLFGILPVLALFVLYERQRLQPVESIRVLGALLAPALVVSAPWLIRNIIHTGNPVFPLLVNIIPSRNAGWDATRAQVLSSVLRRYGGVDKTLLDYLLTPFKLSFLARYANADRYDGIVGPFFLLSLPALVFFRRWRVELRYLLAFAVAFFVFWIATSQQVRSRAACFWSWPAISRITWSGTISATLFSRTTRCSGSSGTRQARPTFPGAFAPSASRTSCSARQFFTARSRHRSKAMSRIAFWNFWRRVA